MQDFSATFPVEPIIGWTTTNYRDRSKNGEVQQMQGFKGRTLEGEPLPAGYWDQDMIAVPEGQFHTGADFFLSTPEQAIEEALKHVRRLVADANRILDSIERIA
jgi:hypothetical protein